MPEYPPEQLQELYKNLPKDLQEALFSEQSALNLQEICRKNSITDDNVILYISKKIGYVLLGLLPLEEIAMVLEKELKIDNNKVQEINREITRFIFYPVKKSLEALYQTEIKYEGEPKKTEKESVAEKKAGKDRYREGFE